MKIKKTIAVFMAVLLLTSLINTQAFAYGSVHYGDLDDSKSKFRILYGLILIAGGGILAYDGFRTIKVETSKPSVRLNFNSFWYSVGTSPILYFTNSAGTIENTGNVDLTNVNVWVRYNTRLANYTPSNPYPELGTELEYGGIAGPLGSLAINESQNWTHGAYWEASLGFMPQGDPSSSPTSPDYVDYDVTVTKPTSAALVDIVDITYDYTKEYKSEMNNVYEGLLGVLLIGGGAYLLIDYVVSLKKFDYYMKKNNMDFYVTNNGDEFKLMLNKRI
ncbi:MAG: hypothetical protein FWG57_01265 [Endomicrobia bacterium]|nr:hypothetical protein [Endomicrobiia bacterium]